MSLDIPERAREAAVATHTAHCCGAADRTVVAWTLDAAAPIVVAAELRRIAAELRAVQPRWASDRDVYAAVAQAHSDRADTLDPEGATS